MVKRADLESEARTFAQQLTALLNSTVADGVRIGAITSDSGATVGLGVKRSNLAPAPVPLTISRAPPRAFLYVSYMFQWSDDVQGLVVSSSDFHIYADEPMEEPIVRFEFERGKEGYPEAHIHVHGDCDALTAICTTTPQKRLEDLHLPVGGRRFRPTLEDVIEMVITEGLAESRSGWREAINEGRLRWERIQLLAAVRKATGEVKDDLRSALSGVE